MKSLNQKNVLDEIIPLLEQQVGDCISIYIPTSPEWRKTEKSKIYLKNNLKKLKDKSHKELADKINKKTAHEKFWKNLSYGLCIYVSDGVEKYLKTPFRVTSSIHIGPYFNIKPLLSHLIDSVEYYILILNKNNVELLKCTDKYYEKIKITSMPNTMDKTLLSDDPQKQIQFKSSVSNSKGRGQTSFHGQGGYKSSEDKNLIRYLSIIDNHIYKEIASTETRVVYAGMDDQFYEYKKISKLNLGEKIISGSFNESNYQKIVNSAWKIIKSESEEIRLKIIQQYKNNVSSDLTTTNTKEIARLAYEGRINTLFVKSLRASYDKVLGDTKYDIVNFSMIHTIKNGGRVFKIKKGEFATKTSLAALLRY